MSRTLTVGEILPLSTRFLKERGSESPRLDAELLAADALGVRRLDLYLAPERPLTPAETDALREAIRRRGRGEPIAYIRGRRDFFGLEIAVSPAVLIPRPETETLVDAAIGWVRDRGVAAPVIVDVGTGSGAIACALAANLPDARIVATDVSTDALAVAARNVATHGLADRVRLVACDLLSGLDDGNAPDLVVSNPPYVAESDRPLMDDGVLRFEPHGALFSGADGTDATFALIDSARARLRPGGALIVEVGTPAQRALVRDRLAR
ncbi:MAG TPA: peptide chain release factor N(5)-glutamine methyltransferase, partial [Myxococcota bacterium]|nr:peptide chain release factor N(5)-glutamine methyltransferase [Myxococcota bacterium]